MICFVRRLKGRLRFFWRAPLYGLNVRCSFFDLFTSCSSCHKTDSIEKSPNLTAKAQRAQRINKGHYCLMIQRYSPSAAMAILRWILVLRPFLRIYKHGAKKGIGSSKILDAFLFYGAEGGNRTRKGSEAQRILSPSRFPFRHPGNLREYLLVSAYTDHETVYFSLDFECSDECPAYKTQILLIKPCR